MDSGQLPHAELSIPAFRQKPTADSGVAPMTFQHPPFIVIMMQDERPIFISPDPRTVLLAEDDESYALLLKCAFKDAGFDHQLHHVNDGAEAMAYLKGEAQYADRLRYPVPCVALVDLKMPKVNGFELLEWIRHHSQCRHLPVVVLTLSDEIRDIQKAYSIGANSFLVKPPRVEELKQIVEMIDSYWLKLNRTENQPQGTIPKRGFDLNPSDMDKN